MLVHVAPGVAVGHRDHVAVVEQGVELLVGGYRAPGIAEGRPGRLLLASSGRHPQPVVQVHHAQLRVVLPEGTRLLPFGGITPDTMKPYLDAGAQSLSLIHI